MAWMKLYEIFLVAAALTMAALPTAAPPLGAGAAIGLAAHPPDGAAALRSRTAAWTDPHRAPTEAAPAAQPALPTALGLVLLWLGILGRRAGRGAPARVPAGSGRAVADAERPGQAGGAPVHELIRRVSAMNGAALSQRR
jgi:hypothetical protein